MTHKPVDVAVVGAGIVGAACAEAFAVAGLSVVVIEPDVIGGGATAAGMGGLEVMDDSEAQFALTRFSRDLWRDLATQLPPEAEYREWGTLWVASDEEELAGAREKQEFAAARGVRAELIDTVALAEWEPNLRPGLAGALLVPGDGIVYSPVVAGWLIEKAARSGATVIQGVGASELREGTVRLTDGSEVAAGVIVNAAGMAAAKLMPELPLHPKKGHLAITDRYPGFAHHQLIELGYLKSAHGGAKESVAFNVQPRPTGQLLIGSSRQIDVEDTAVEPAMLARMLRRAMEYMPGLAELSTLRTWTGFRAATPDNLPLIGPYPGGKGLYAAAGHEGLGITTALGTARLLADCFLGRESEISPEPYWPERFSKRGGA